MPNIYESWDLSIPEILPRSTLYQIEAIGIGTPLVESLTGYFARLSEAHCLIPGVLMEKKFAPLLNKTYGGTLNKIYKFTGAINGTGIMAADLVQALQNLTLRNDLEFLTLLNWSELLPSRNLLRSVRAWCPACYKEWYQTSQIVYEPLLWVFDVVKVCPYHKQKLSQKCPHCNETNYTLAWQSRPGYCSKCGDWLGSQVDTDIATSKILSQAELEFEIWVATTIGELLAYTPHLKFPLSKENIAKALYAYIEQVTEGNMAAFARLLQIPKNTLWFWCKGESQPSLQALLKICYSLKISILDFLIAGIESASSLKKNRLLPVQAQTKPRASSKPFDTDKVKKYLTTMLMSNEYPPPSMEEVARRINCDRRTIFRHFRDLCSAISAKYIQYRKACYSENVEICCKEVREITTKLHTIGDYPSEARVSAFMSKPGYLRNKKVRAALSEIRQELGL